MSTTAMSPISEPVFRDQRDETGGYVIINNHQDHQSNDEVNNNAGLKPSSPGTDKKPWSKKIAHRFTRERLAARFPILKWIPNYSGESFIYDLVAGITVGLTIIPQGIAYAAVAGLPLQYGLYSSFIGPLCYIILGSAKEISIGPTAVMALMTFSYSNQGGPAYAVLLAFMAGCIELLAGLLNLGFVVEFISAPVISGFCSAAAITVASTQVKGWLGLKFEGSSFVAIWGGVFTNLSKVNPWDAGLGAVAIVILLMMRKMTTLKDVRRLKSCCSCLQNRYVNSAVWFISTSRNALAVILSCVATYLLEVNSYKPFTLTGSIKPGLPSFEVPHFSMNKTVGNSTETLYFQDICSDLGAAIGLIPLIAILEQVAIAKAFAHGKRTDSTQEMIAIGVSTLLSSFFGSMPISASFGRSAVQAASGVRTPLSNIYGGILVLLALAFLMPTLAYIPKAILAAVIITSVIFMVEYEEIKPMWNSRRVELVPFVLTFLCCLFINVEYGILIGMGIHLFILAYMGNKPKSVMYRLPDVDSSEEKVVLRVDRNLYFPGVETFRKSMHKAYEEIEGKKIPGLILDMENSSELDYTALKMLESQAKKCQNKDQLLQFTNASKSVKRSITSIIHSENVVFI